MHSNLSLNIIITTIEDSQFRQVLLTTIPTILSLIQTVWLPLLTVYRIFVFSLILRFHVFREALCAPFEWSHLGRPTEKAHTLEDYRHVRMELTILTDAYTSSDTCDRVSRRMGREALA